MATEETRPPLSILQVLEKNVLTTGSVVQMSQLALGLARRGHRVAVVSRPGDDLAALCREGGVDFIPLPLRHSFDVGSARRLAAIYDERNVDVVHVHKGIAHAIALLATVFCARRPALVVNRGVSFPLDAFNRLKYHVRLDAVVAVSARIREVLTASGGLPPEKVHVIHGGVDTARFDPERVDRGRVRREWQVPDDERLVVQVGGRDWKGWRDLLEAARRIVPRFPSLRVAVVACKDEEEKRRVAAAAGEKRIGERVLPVGFRMDMPEVLAAADVVTDLSYAGTGITGTIREAMAMGRAVVASAIGGNVELVEDGVSGLVVPPNDPGAAAAALDRLLSDDALRGRLGQAARERVRRGFSLEGRLDRVEALYRGLTAGRARGRATEAARSRSTSQGGRGR
jgi:glycosyltransferase involved in cell wall biosynthesis